MPRLIEDFILVFPLICHPSVYVIAVFTVCCTARKWSKYPLIYFWWCEEKRQMRGKSTAPKVPCLAFWSTDQLFVMKLSIPTRLGPIVQHLYISQNNSELDCSTHHCWGETDSGTCAIAEWALSWLCGRTAIVGARCFTERFTIIDQIIKPVFDW